MYAGRQLLIFGSQLLNSIGVNPWNETEIIGTLAAKEGAASGKETKGTISKVSERVSADGGPANGGMRPHRGAGQGAGGASEVTVQLARSFRGPMPLLGGK